MKGREDHRDRMTQEAVCIINLTGDAPALMFHLHGTPARPRLPSTPGAWPRGGLGGGVPYPSCFHKSSLSVYSGPGRSETLPCA